MTAHWGIPDPAAVAGSDMDKRKAFFKAYNQLQHRLSIFVNLPMDKLDRLTLQRRLDDRSGHRAVPRSSVNDLRAAECSGGRRAPSPRPFALLELLERFHHATLEIRVLAGVVALAPGDAGFLGLLARIN